MVKLAKEYGKWTILQEAHGKYVLCKCKCGTEKNVNKYNLLNGQSTSCGKCLKNAVKIDDRYGKWIITGIISSKNALCRCECGTEKPVVKYHLLDGRSTSCGKCQRDLSGLKFGKLIVLKHAGYKIINGHKHSNQWLCKCDCGNEVVRTTSTLQNSSTDCNDPKCRFGYGLAAQHRLYLTYKKSSKKRGIKFRICKELFIHLTSQNCHYCGSSPQKVQKSTHNNGDYVYNGIDRIDNTKGYIKTNVVPCCTYCNAGKLDRTTAEFNRWIEQLFTVYYKPTWEEKCWGRAWHRFYDEHLGESLLEVNKGWQCSIHWHADRWNSFISTNAVLEIECFGSCKNEPSLETSTILEPGNSFAVMPKIWHRFRVLESGKIIETYWTNDGSLCKFDDIIRWDEGGVF